VDGLPRDKKPKSGKKPLPAETVKRVVDLALGPPPGETTHWTGRLLLATAVGISLRSVQSLLHAHQFCTPPRSDFKLSKESRKSVFVLVQLSENWGLISA
jgi:hypothetical protein